jgi:ppGpp synthetase/RelA/SpoT-type nucleotidyltranferase
MAIIDDFVREYQREFHIKDKVAKIAEAQCRAFLDASAVRAIVTSRAKDPDRLRAKLEKRSLENGRGYASFEDIRNDIHDFSGVRIALYSPGDAATVGERICQQFTVRHTRPFPDRRADAEARLVGAASGYLATHYRVLLDAESLSGADKGLSGDPVEIQVASLLMHAWSEVEHDLRYKPLSGKLSPAEEMLLDGLNDLITAGETTLIRLQRATSERIEGRDEPFEDPYTLAAYLYTTLQQRANGYPVASIGRAELLLAFLNQLEMNRPKQLRLLTDFVYAEADRPVLPVATQIVDILLMRDPALFRQFNEVRKSLQASFPAINQATIYDFFEEWVACVVGFNYLGGPVLSTDYHSSGNLRAITRSGHPGNPVHQAAIISARSVYFSLIEKQGDITDVQETIDEAIRGLQEVNAARLPQLDGETQRLIAQARERVGAARLL